MRGFGLIIALFSFASVRGQDCWGKTSAPHIYQLFNGSSVCLDNKLIPKDAQAL
jgi:hypothetical protein